MDWAIFHTEDALQLLAPRTPEIRYYMALQPVSKLCQGGKKLFQFQLMWIGRNADIERSIACYLCARLSSDVLVFVLLELKSDS